MSQMQQAARPPARFHDAAYEFVDQALRFSQKKFGKRVETRQEFESDDAHISGQQLLEGIRELALKEFGLMAIPVFRHWGVHSTDDFGRIVWDLIQRGQLRKTPRDQLSDFCGVYDFETAFDQDYHIDTSQAFRRS